MRYMRETTTDKYGCQVCPDCGARLQLRGSWKYNARIVPGKYGFQCPKCFVGYVGDVAETLLHQEGEEAADKAAEVQSHLDKVAALRSVNEPTVAAS